jgi:hypothetical protein
MPLPLPSSRAARDEDYTGRMVWEAVFMLLVLKIPIVYLGFVVWWAIRAEPRQEDPEAPVRVTDTPPNAPVWSRRDRRGRRGPRPGPPRRPVAPRSSPVHAERGR